MEIIEKLLNELHPYENNARHNREAVKYVANSISSFGFRNPVLIDKDGVIIAGHTRYEAAKELGLKKVPCILIDDLTPAQVKALRLADNKVGEIATWDLEKLEQELDDLVVEFDMPMWDFGFELNDKHTDFKEDDFTEDAVEEDSQTTKKRFSVVVDLDDEIDQQALFEQLQNDGYVCKMVTV